MSWKVANLCAERRFGSPVRKQIIMFLADKASDDGSGIWCSKGTVQRHTELGESTVKRTITEFLREGLLVETGRRPCKNGYTVIYRIVLGVVNALETISEPDDEPEFSTGPTADGVPHDPGTGSAPDGVPGPERTPNHPKTIQKPPTRADTREAEDRDFEKAWAAYPPDRRRNKTTCRQQFERAIEDGTTAEEFICAVNAYATETEGYTRSKVCFSDNWFRESRWQRFVEEAREAQIDAAELEGKHFRQLAGWVRERNWMCQHISRNQAGELLLRGLVSEPELRRAEVAW
ncbi:hypothetical protein SAMN05216196_104332 [Lutimaribacter pacificus]|uniref:Helix-turn-helix domain-containing protein n=1 Tax=Lutimaribacter pacificus TaxID=391948 RepID=A0A1H0IBY6_9RHOB|nr:hypothetical protein [Lutimaribacter pacificus]SDO28893.1 hypothetical protein SAMN05216196_104332 [Lutimaribacter pacificus]SHK23743.1 hypothetical protein SAMN05444142_10453 [Lutimaribacter pacificus]